MLSAGQLPVPPGLSTATPEQVAAYCRKELTGYKNPKSIVFRDALPKSNVGKILRRELRDLDKAGK